MDMRTTKRNNICVNETIKDENVKEINHLHQHVDNNLGIQKENDCCELQCAGERHTVDCHKECKDKSRESVGSFTAASKTTQLEKENSDTTALCDKHESYGLNWVSGNDSEKYKKTLEEGFISTKSNIETKEYICNLEHNKYKLQHKTDSSLNVDIVGNNNVKHKVK